MEHQESNLNSNREQQNTAVAAKGLFSAPLLAVVALLLVATIGAGGYFLWQSGNTQPPAPQTSNSPVQVMDGSDGPLPTRTPLVAQVVPTKAPATSTPPPTPTALPTETSTVVSSDTPVPPTDTPAVPTNAPTLPVDTPALPVPTRAVNPAPTPRPSTGGTVANSGPGLPTRLRIPAIGVSAAVEKVGVASDGTMGIPVDEWDVGWYKRGYRPGATGNAVIDGHLDWTHGPAVFWNLSKLNVGDAIYVTDDQGVERKFTVTDMVAYPYDNAPLNAIFGPANAAHLNLITCNGVYSHTAHNYNKRLVVYTTLASVAQQ